MFEAPPKHRNRLVLTLGFVALWVFTWVTTVVSWETDAAGYGIGMGPAVPPLHLFLPLLLGLLIGWAGGPGCPWNTCAVAGGVFAAAHSAVMRLVDWLWLPVVKEPAPTADLWAEGVAFALGFVLIAALLAVLGGAIGRSLRGTGEAVSSG